MIDIKPVLPINPKEKNQMPSVPYELPTYSSSPPFTLFLFMYSTMSMNECLILRIPNQSFLMKLFSSFY